MARREQNPNGSFATSSRSCRLRGCKLQIFPMPLPGSEITSTSTGLHELAARGNRGAKGQHIGGNSSCAPGCRVDGLRKSVALGSLGMVCVLWVPHLRCQAAKKHARLGRHLSRRKPSSKSESPETHQTTGKHEVLRMSSCRVRKKQQSRHPVVITCH